MPHATENTHPEADSLETLGIPLLLTSREVAATLGVTPDRVRQLRRAGTITPAFVTPQGVSLYDNTDVVAFAQRRVAASAAK